MKKSVSNIERRMLNQLRELYFDYLDLKKIGCGRFSFESAYLRYGSAMEFYLIAFNYTYKRENNLIEKWYPMWRKERGLL